MIFSRFASLARSTRLGRRSLDAAADARLGHAPAGVLLGHAPSAASLEAAARVLPGRAPGAASPEAAARAALGHAPSAASLEAAAGARPARRSASAASTKSFVRSVTRIVTLVLLATAVMASVAAAQVTPKKRPSKPSAGGPAQTVEIRGQVPTPQVVTVRPRAVPDYSRGVLVPAFYDQHFWPSILAPYRVVPTLPSESTHRPPEAAPDSTAGSPPPSRE